MCSVEPCINSHECNNVGHDYYCSCKHGWTGKNCTESKSNFWVKEKFLEQII